MDFQQELLLHVRNTPKGTDFISRWAKHFDKLILYIFECWFRQKKNL